MTAAMTGATRIRPARATDLPLLYRAELAYMCEIEPGSVDRWMGAIDRNLELWTDNLGRAFVVEADSVEADGVAAGIALWMPDGGSAVVVTIHVLPQFRRRGLARVLLGALAGDARAHGFTTMTLGVHRTNPAARLYEEFGFTRTHTDGDYLYYALPTT